MFSSSKWTVIIRGASNSPKFFFLAICLPFNKGEAHGRRQFLEVPFKVKKKFQSYFQDIGFPYSKQFLTLITWRYFVFFKKSSLLIQVFLIIFFVISGNPAVADDRQTKTMVLDNGLAVIMVHDPDVHRSAAALSVGVGQLHDPKDKMGLAHYLAHMLFLGTKKFPEAGSYKKYLNENSGASNAYTAASNTNYFFEVSHDAYEGALDRFSDFFKAPLFAEKYAEREVNAVSSEHDKNTRSDGWRASYVKDLISEPGHPISSFGTGNKETLAGDNRPALLSFYKKYYAASNMKLVLLSSLSLEAQAELVRNFFSEIPVFKVEEPFIDPEYRKSLNGKYRLLKIKSIKDVRSLELDFTTIRLVDHLEGKPQSILASIIGHEGKGSLLSKLKEEGLALSLSAGGGFSHPNINSFTINLSLTRKGLEQYETILEQVFSYIEMLKQHGIEKYSYQESAKMAKIDFEWKNKDEGMGFAAGRAALMHEYDLKDIETLPYLFKKFEPEAYRKILDTLTPENLRVTLMANSLSTDRTAKYYGTEYSITEVEGDSFNRLKNPPPTSGMSYPKGNEFIPNNLQLVGEEPHLVWDDDRAQVWFMFDHRFKQPKVMMQLRIETPLVYDTVEHLMLAKLYDAAIGEGLNEMVYTINLAGLSYSLSLEKKGVVLSIGGYSERISDLLNLVIQNLMEIKINEQKFDNIKEAMIRGLKNRELGQSYSRAGYYNYLMLLEKQYTDEERLEAIQPLTLDKVKAYVAKLYEKVYITGLAHGNWSEEKVRESIRFLLDKIKSKPLPPEERFEQVVEVLDSGESILFSRKVLDNNNSIIYGLQAGEKSFELSARLSMVASILESDFYTQMRTRQQLGYIVWSYNQMLEERLFLKFIIQSANHSPFELARRIEAWMAGSRALFENLSDEEFMRHQASLIVSLSKEGESIGEVASDLFYLATEEKGDFRYKKKLIKAVESLTKNDVFSLARSLLHDVKTPRLAVLIRSSNNDESIPPGVLTEVEQFKKRKLRVN